MILVFWLAPYPATFQIPILKFMPKTRKFAFTPKTRTYKFTPKTRPFLTT